MSTPQTFKSCYGWQVHSKQYWFPHFEQLQKDQSSANLRCRQNISLPLPPQRAQLYHNTCTELCVCVCACVPWTVNVTARDSLFLQCLSAQTTVGAWVDAVKTLLCTFKGVTCNCARWGNSERVNMYSQRLAIFVTTLVFISASTALDFCELHCVKDIYSTNCGTAQCVAGITSSSEVRGCTR